MTLIVWLALGLMAGWIASWITSTPPEGRLANVVVGIIGAIVGGILLKIFGSNPSAGLDPISLLTAVLGAAILLSLIRHVHRPTL